MGSMGVSKPVAALQMLQAHPMLWFRSGVIDARDHGLLTTDAVAFARLDKGSFLRKITNWVVETDDQCKNLVRSAGGQLVGFDLPAPAPVHWASVTVNVNVKGAPGAGFDWGYLSTRPANIRIFKGPPQTCDLHPWDAMILRDCTTNTDTLNGLEYIASRKWDILVMKMCEDYDHPWVVVAIKDAGTRELDAERCGCQDSTECGCVLAG